MAGGVVFKQRYKSVNLKSTPTLNRKHLIYIATRKGAIHNPGCSFGLWGRLSDMQESRNINSLEAAKKTVTAASHSHTLYRAILSVDHDTAKTHDLYARGTWQPLVDQKVSVLAQQMGIERKDFCWCASMHYAKGHPHVHILYWDNSSKVRQEFVPPERFEIIAEKVRAEFGREIYQEELHTLQGQQRGLISEARLELQSLCREVNLADALDLKHVSEARLSGLQESFAALAAKLPTHGALKYAYLPPEAKEHMDAFLGEIMQITDFRRLETAYLKLTDEVSKLYGNGPDKINYNREKARETLYKGMGNTVLAALKEYKRELEQEAPAERDDLLLLARNTVGPLLAGHPAYRAFLSALPKERTTIRELLSLPDVKPRLDALVRELCGDLRVRAMADGHIRAVSQHGHLDKESWVALKKEVYRDLFRAVRDVVWEQARRDAGYEEQQTRDVVLRLLLQLFRGGSQGNGQVQSQRDLLLLKSRELSETALLDRRKQHEQAGGWSQGL